MTAWRAMRAEDLDRVLDLAAVIHPAYPEARAVFAERLALHPRGCLILEEEGSPCGYALTHPWRYGRPPALDTLLAALPEHPDTYYLHDIALLPGARGRGHAGQLLARLIAHAGELGLANLSLVAVNASRPVWERCGFSAPDMALPALASYGGTAVFMTRALCDAGP